MASSNLFAFYFPAVGEVVEILEFLKKEGIDRFMFFDRNAVVDYFEDYTAGNWLLAFTSSENFDDNLDFEDEIEDKGGKKAKDDVKQRISEAFDKDWKTVMTEDKVFVSFTANLDQIEEVDRKIRLKMMNAECDMFGNGKSNELNCNYWWIYETQVEGKQLRTDRIKEIVTNEGLSLIDPYSF